MKLSKKSWHAKVYEISYGRDAGFPANLCPYFWKFLVALIFFIPLSLFMLIPALAAYIVDKFSGDKNTFVDNGYFSWLIFFGLVANGVAFELFAMVYVWFQPFLLMKDGELYWYQRSALVGYSLLISVGGFFLIRHWILNIRRNRDKVYVEHKEAASNILIEFVKAKYKRYCPKINWQEKQQSNIN